MYVDVCVFGWVNRIVLMPDQSQSHTHSHTYTQTTPTQHTKTLMFRLLVTHTPVCPSCPELMSNIIQPPSTTDELHTTTTHYNYNYTYNYTLQLHITTTTTL